MAAPRGPDFGGRRGELEGRRESLVRRFRLPAALLGAAALMAFAVADVLAGCGDVDAATLSGTWQLRITISAYTGGTPGAGEKPVGTTGVITVALSTTCAAAGVCTAEMHPVSGSLGPELYDSTTGFYWDVDTGLDHGGSTFSGVAPAAASAGSACPPAGRRRASTAIRPR